MASGKNHEPSFVSDAIWRSYQEGSRFFMRKGDIYATLQNLIAELDEKGLDYAVIGGMALVAYGYRRFTEDIDILMTSEALQTFRESSLARGYLPAFAGATKSFRDTKTGVRIEIVAAGEYPGDGKPKPVRFPNPTEARFQSEGLWIITLEKLIELKLASGMTAPHRLRDLSDVQELILSLKLPSEFEIKIDPSVRAEFHRLWINAQVITTEA
jgi:hypothetical protein